MLQRIRERLALILIAFLPFHALFVTLGTRLIEGPNHAPLAVLAIWKEALLGTILLLSIAELIAPAFAKATAARHSSKLKARIDWIDILILALLVIALALFATGNPGSLRAFLIGFRYDFVPLLAFIILRRVLWSDTFLRLTFTVLFWDGVIIAIYGLLTVALPISFFTALGYSDLHSLYLPEAPVAAFQQVGGSLIRRLQSTMSGPNQLGLWLLLPLTIAILRKNRAVFFLLLVALFGTLSRDAVLAMGVIVVLILWKKLPRRTFFRIAGAVLAIAVVLGIGSLAFAPTILLRSGSTIDHIARPLEAMHVMIEHPLGLGLSAAGPASNHLHETCVFLRKGDDPSWAADRPELCVFVGGKQVQPPETKHVCDCPLLPENWYVQIGVETGFLGMFLYVALIALILKKLTQGNAVVFLVFLGVSLAALFLHAWEDSALAYTLWMLAAVTLSFVSSSGSNEPA